MASPNRVLSFDRQQRRFRFLFPLALILSSAASLFAQTVTISQPANNATVSSSLRVVAKASATNAIKYTQVYVDGVARYTVQSASLDTTVSLTSGAHRIAVQAVDTRGNIGKSVVNVTASTTQSGPPTVTINQPSDNAKVPTSLRVVAKGNGSKAISYTQIYVDGAAKYTAHSSSVDTTITLTPGTHRIAVQATDTQGNQGKSIANVTASAATEDSDSTKLTVITRIEESSEWLTCGNCGNTGASGATATYHMTRGLTSPSTDGSATEFSIGGNNPFKNGYWYIRQPAPTTPVSYLKYEFDLYVPKQYETAPQAIEFECQQKVDGYIYNFAWQANYAGKSWRIFDYVNRKWDASGLSFSGFTPDTWHHIIAEYHTDGSNVVHDALTIDGVRKAVNKRHPAKATSSGRSFTNAFQLDLNGKATDYKVYVDGMKISLR